MLRLLSHEGVRDSVHSVLANPIYAGAASNLDFEKLAALYARFASGQEGPQQVPWMCAGRGA